METTSPKFFCFVLMPFDKAFDDIYNYGIKESCKEVDAYCERVDEQMFEERMTDRIYNQIAKADLIIADMTGKNPNVFYEVGYAHALNKPTILLTQKSEDIPFDLKDYPHIIYNNSIKNIKSELPRRIDWYKENRSEKIVLKNDLEIIIDGKIVNDKTEIIRTAPVKYFDFTIHNKSLRYYDKNEYQIGIICSGILYTTFQEIDFHRFTNLSDDKNLSLIPSNNSIYPNGYEIITIHPQLLEHVNTAQLFDFEIRIYTLLNEFSFKFSLKTEPNPNLPKIKSSVH